MDKSKKGKTITTFFLKKKKFNAFIEQNFPYICRPAWLHCKVFYIVLCALFLAIASLANEIINS